MLPSIFFLSDPIWKPNFPSWLQKVGALKCANQKIYFTGTTSSWNPSWYTMELNQQGAINFKLRCEKTQVDKRIWTKLPVDLWLAKKYYLAFFNQFHFLFIEISISYWDKGTIKLALNYARQGQGFVVSKGLLYTLEISSLAYFKE